MEKIKFEEYGIEFNNDDFENVGTKALDICINKINEFMKKNNIKEDTNG